LFDHEIMEAKREEAIDPDVRVPGANRFFLSSFLKILIVFICFVSRKGPRSRGAAVERVL
jgi:hypothetical protein